LEPVSRALRHGLVALHPSTSTAPIIEGMIGRVPNGVRALGMVRPKGLCISLERQQEARRGDALGRPAGGFPYTWLLRDGRLQVPTLLADILRLMGPGDVYIKGCNALDRDGLAGVLFASPGAGTIGAVMAAQRRRGFTIVLPVGLEKAIPGTIAQASKATIPGRVKYSTGQRCGVIPVPGRVISEAEAFKILFGVGCRPIAAGGVGGGEGSVVLVLEGREPDVVRAFEHVLELKKEAPPDIPEATCAGCPIDRCLMPRGCSA
jgi:hypothetical protein